MKRLVTATLLLSAAFTVAAQASSAHTDKFSCYAYVHDSCFGEGSANCSQESYEWGLNECDVEYPSSSVKRPTATFGTAPNNKVVMQTRAKIQRSFDK
jgi:hypothetical protein